MKNKKVQAIFGFSVRDIAEIAIFSAIAILLDRFIKIPLGETGGSINLSMLPLFIIALRHGPFKAFLAGGLVYGIICCILDNYGIATYPLEYLVAYGSVALLGFFAKFVNNHIQKDNPRNTFIGYLVFIGCVAGAAVIRFFAASIDSVILYDYSFKAAFAYNVGYVFLSAVGVCVVLCLLLPYIKVINNEFPSKYIQDME